MLQWEVRRLFGRRALFLSDPRHPWDYFHGFSRIVAYL